MMLGGPRARRWWLRNRPHAAIEAFYVAREWGWRFALELERHRRRHLGRILETPPLAVPDSGSPELHVVVNRSRSTEGIWTVKSLFWQTDEPLALRIHDDGSLGHGERQHWLGHFPGCRIIPRHEADGLVTRVLSKRGHSGLAAWRDSFPLALKLLDVNLLARAAKVVVLDTDVVFSARPAELLEVAADPSPQTACFNGDFASVYSLPLDVLRLASGVSVFEKINTGVAAFSPSIIDLERLEAFLGSPLAGEEAGWFLKRREGWFLEQTLYAIELSRVRASRLPATYMVGQLPEPPGITCGHYCTRARLDMYRSAYPRVLERMAYPVRS